MMISIIELSQRDTKHDENHVRPVEVQERSSLGSVARWPTLCDRALLEHEHPVNKKE